jgi:hypothetical protein
MVFENSQHNQRHEPKAKTIKKRNQRLDQHVAPTSPKPMKRINPNNRLDVDAVMYLIRCRLLHAFSH